MKKICGILAILVGLATIAYFVNRTPLITVGETEDFEESAKTFNDNLVEKMNSDEVVITVAGVVLEEFDYEFYVSDEMKLMVEGEFLKRLLGCSVLEYSDDTVLIMCGEDYIYTEIGSNQALVNDYEHINLGSTVKKEGGKLFIPMDAIAK